MSLLTPCVSGWLLRHPLPCLALALLGVTSASGGTFHVDQATGSDDAAGTSAGEPFQTIQKACDVVVPGDCVIIHPGVYFETPRLRTAGTAEAPIVFRADRVEPARVVISGADPAIRCQKVTWEMVDPDLNLYAVPYPEKPSRVLYDHVDLLPYPKLENLRTFRFENGCPGTRHGFAFRDGRLYVRLHEAGKYGSLDPNDHIMAVGPAGSRSGGAGIHIQAKRDSIWALQTGGPSHTVLDGFTFETPGIAAVYAPEGDVTVRNCWFRGCRSGVSGRVSSPDISRNTNRVTIEHCDYGQFPAFDDMLEVIALHREDPWRGDRGKLVQRIFWWQRKGDQPQGGIGYGTTYETGIATHIGNDWVISANIIHDSMEALSMWGTDHSTNLQVYGNRIERIVDNAIECENRAINLSFYDNKIVDVFEPFSWQPLRATPWPGPVAIYSNQVSTSPAVQGIWQQAGHTPGIWKLGASEKNWRRRDIKISQNEPVRVPGEGFRSYDNIIYCPGSVALTRVQSSHRPFENFRISDNVFVLDGFSAHPGDRFGNIQFAGNAGVFLKPQDSAAEVFTSHGGMLVEPIEGPPAGEGGTANEDGVQLLTWIAHPSQENRNGTAFDSTGPLVSGQDQLNNTSSTERKTR